MLEMKEKEIDGHVFRYQPLMATEARRILLGLIQRFGGSVAAGIEGMAGQDLDNIDMVKNASEVLGKMANSIAGIIRQITTSLTPEYYERLVEKLGKRTTIRVVADSGQSDWPELTKGTRDLMFGTSLLTEAKWVAFCLEVQYADFFELARGAIAKAAKMAAKKMKSQSSSQRVSTGTSNE